MEARLSATGWFVVETIERMQDHHFSTGDIMDALDLPSEDHMNQMLQWAARERQEMVDDLLGN